MIMEQAIKRSERYRKLKAAGKSNNEINKAFRKSANDDILVEGERDTILLQWIRLSITSTSYTLE